MIQRHVKADDERYVFIIRGNEFRRAPSYTAFRKVPIGRRTDLLTSALAFIAPGEPLGPFALLFLGVPAACALFDREYRIRALFPEALVIKLLDELGERQLPQLLFVIVELAELLGIHAELARHLDLCMGEPMALACLDPEPEPIRYPSSRHDRNLRPANWFHKRIGLQGCLPFRQKQELAGSQSNYCQQPIE